MKTLTFLTIPGMWLAVTCAGMATGAASVGGSGSTRPPSADLESSTPSVDWINKLVDRFIEWLVTPRSQYVELEGQRKYITEWEYCHTIRADLFYCVPLGQNEIYAARPYQWKGKAMVFITLTNAANGRMERVKIPVPEGEYSETANWKFNDGDWREDLARNLEWQTPMHTENKGTYNVYCQAVLNEREQHRWSGSFTLFGITYTRQITVEPGKKFADQSAIDQLITYRYCQCTACKGTCQNNFCMGGCRDTYCRPPAPHCEICRGAISCCYSEDCPYWQTMNGNDCTCRFVTCGEHPWKTYCATHGVCSYCHPQDALAALRPPATYKVLAASEPAWLGKARKMIAAITRWAKS